MATNNQTSPAQPHPSPQQSIYQELDLEQLKAIKQQYQWLVDPIERASQALLKMPFFTWLKTLPNAQAFKPAAVQLYYHSATFPKVLGLMLGNTSQSENSMMPFYARHAFGEADHHELLMQWMLKHGILQQRQEIDDVIVSLETNACINLAYRLAVERDRDIWITAINCGIEQCSNDFFKCIAKKMHELNAGDFYFDTHVEADEHHSIMGLQYLNIDPHDTKRKRLLISKGLEGISLWASMLHSWIDIDIHPKFKLDGSLA